MPRFTVVCPTYNRGTAILPTLESVRAQTLRDWELIVVSDASTDDTDTVVEQVAAVDSRVRLLRTPRFGSQSGPTNIALREAAGDHVAYLDHDDTWEPEHLAVLAAAFDRGARFVGTRSRLVDPAGAVTLTMHPLSLCWHPELQLMAPLFGNSCAAHDTGLAELVGGWRESPVGLEDWDLWLRLADAGVACTTLLDRTVSILKAPYTRQNTLPCPHRHHIVRCTDRRSARAAYRSVTDRRHEGAVREAARADITAWYLGLADRGELVFPRGWTGGAAALPDAVRSHVLASPLELHTLTIEECEDGFRLGFPVQTMTAGHADRYAAFFRRTMSRQQDLLAGLLPPGCVLL